MEEFLSDVIHIGASIIVVSFIYIIIYSRIINARKRSGKLKPKQLIEYTSFLMIAELQQNGYKTCGLGKLDSLISLDSYIDKKKELYNKEELINDNDLILRLGCFFGQLLRIKKHFYWKFSEDLIPRMVREEEIIYPFELVKQKINGSLASLYEYAMGL